MECSLLEFILILESNQSMKTLISDNQWKITLDQYYDDLKYLTNETNAYCKLSLH